MPQQSDYQGGGGHGGRKSRLSRDDIQGKMGATAYQGPVYVPPGTVPPGTMPTPTNQQPGVSIPTYQGGSRLGEGGIRGSAGSQASPEVPYHNYGYGVIPPPQIPTYQGIDPTTGKPYNQVTVQPAGQGGGMYTGVGPRWWPVGTEPANPMNFRPQLGNYAPWYYSGANPADLPGATSQGGGGGGGGSWNGGGGGGGGQQQAAYAYPDWATRLLSLVANR